MSSDAYDRYAFLLPLCGTAAFRLPPTLPGGRPLPDEDLPENPLGPIPDHLLCKHLCFQSSPPRPAAAALSLLDLPTPPSNSVVNSSSGVPLLHDPLHSCDVSNPDCLASDQGYTNLQDSEVVHEQWQCAENLPLCVVNYQASLPSTPEGQQSSAAVEAGDLCDEIPMLLLSEIKELALRHEDSGLEDNDTKHILSVMTAFRNLAFAAGYSEKLLCQIKELALWDEGNVLVGNDIKCMVSVMKKFRNLAFSREGRRSTVYESDLREPSKKKQRQSQAKSNTVVSASCFTQYKSSNAAAANCNVVDLDDCRSTKRKSKGKENDYQVGSIAYLSSGCSNLVFGNSNVEIIDLTDDSPSTREKFNSDAPAKFLVVCRKSCKGC